MTTPATGATITTQAHVTLTRARHGGTALTPDRDAATPVSSATRGHVTCVWPMT